MRDAEYFPHDYNAQDDLNIARLLRAHGWQAYGLFWAIVEKLYSNRGRMAADFELLAYQLRAEAGLIQEIVTKFDLFFITKGMMASHSVDRRLKEREEKRLKGQESAARRWGANGYPLGSQWDPNARKERKAKEKKGKREGGDGTALALASRQIFVAWNERADAKLPRAMAVTDKRMSAAKARWTENPDIAYWQGLIAKINVSPFCLGEKGWTANIDWLLRPDTGAKIAEGQYGSAPVKTAPAVKCLGCSSRKPEPGAKFCRECSWCYKCDNDGRESKKDPTNLTRTDKGQLCGDCLRGIKC